MKMIKVTLLVSMLALLGGCMVVPVNPGPVGYYGPSIGIGIYGGGHGGGHGGGYGRGYGRH